MHPHPALSLALITEFSHERTRHGPAALRPAPQLPPPRRLAPPGGTRGCRLLLIARRARCERPSSDRRAMVRA
jgi:hypothetical protein